MEYYVIAVLAGIGGTVGTLALSIWVSRKWGLPGLAREVDAQQDRLILALRENNDLLRTENDQLKIQNGHLVSQNEHLVTENRDLRAKLATAYDDIATLYRGQGRRVPPHVVATRAELNPGTRPEAKP